MPIVPQYQQSPPFQQPPPLPYAPGAQFAFNQQQVYAGSAPSPSPGPSQAPRYSTLHAQAPAHSAPPGPSSLPLPPGLPTRPSFAAPPVNATQMQHFHHGGMPAGFSNASVPPSTAQIINSDSPRPNAMPLRPEPVSSEASVAAVEQKPQHEVAADAVPAATDTQDMSGQAAAGAADGDVKKAKKVKDKDKAVRLVYSDNEVSPEEKMAKMSRYAFDPASRKEEEYLGSAVEATTTGVVIGQDDVVDRQD